MSSSDMINSILSATALVVAVVALVYTARTFFLKVGQKVRCNFGIASSMDCDDKYVSNLILENAKDRAIVIFKIYLRIGSNYFLELEDHTKEPLIIGSYEVHQKEYDPVLFYSVYPNRIKIDKLLDNKKVKKAIVLSTTDGRYEVKTYLRQWDAIGTLFKNYMTGIIQPMRLGYKERDYGINVKYLVVLKYADDTEQVLKIREGDDRLVLFRNFQLTKDSLGSKEALQEFMNRQKELGKIHFVSIEIIEHQKLAREEYELEKMKVLEAKQYGFFKYHIIGKLLTVREDRRMRATNKRTAKGGHIKKAT
jgi:hypothetical protein